MSYYTYILLCSDDSYYVGITNNIENRFKQHCNGYVENSYTYARRPLKLVYYEKCQYVINAIAREKQLKGWSRKKKEALINKFPDELKVLAKKIF
ncbi:MAG TPA: GIY-YIG nuclease family protein [Brumimicrobium sp.]|nr:GIY-YIG nuclease family protein [Brumimicrobium sp.]